MRLDFSHTRIIIRPGATNMQASREQVLEIIKSIMKDDPFTGAVFIFCNRRRNILKMIWWDKTGFWVAQKKLENRKTDNQPSLFDYEDEAFIPSETELENSVAGEGPYQEVKIQAYIRRKCGRKAIDNSTPTKQVYHDISEEEKICDCERFF